MKQIIIRYYNNNINYKYYLNHLNQANRLWIGYQNNGSIWHKANYLNDKLIGLDNSYNNNNNNNKPTNITYHL